MHGIAGRFAQGCGISDIREYGSGNINDTYLVTLDSGNGKRFVLQRVNTRVFRRPELVMSNMRYVTGHMRERLRLPRLRETPSGMEGRRWEVPEVLLTEAGGDHHIDADGSFWRAISFIEASRSFDTVRDAGHASEVGFALGAFHSLLSDLPVATLADTLEGFHVTPGYLRRYDEVLLDGARAKGKGNGRDAEVDHCLRFVEERRPWAGVLENARADGRLRLRPIHGDPKVNNVMMDTATGLAVGLIDLDTVKPGLIHYDIGDCLRSACNPLGEANGRWRDVRFDVDLCRAVLRGYFSQARDFLDENDREYIYEAGRLIAFELGLRFFTDYLEGNVYFKVSYPDHNLVRALVQFRLTESIETQAASIGAVIRELI